MTMARRRLGCVCAWAVALGWLCSAAEGAPTSAVDTQRIDQFVAAGEFSAALDALTGLPRPERDPWLRRIALAQVAGGNREAAVDTLARMTSTAARHEALAEFDAVPIPSSGAAGGGVQPDFDSLIELITKTVAPTTWVDVGGQGSIEEFPAGVWVDAAGVLRRREARSRTDLAAVRAASQPRAGDASPRRASPLRKVSLVRLERELELHRAAGRPLDEALLVLAGLQRVEYVFVYPDEGDVVLAGPAGDWRFDAEGRTVAVDTGRPVVRLGDLTALLGRVGGGEGTFGCTIEPTAEGLARLQAFARESAEKPLRPGEAARRAWAATLRERLGLQSIRVFGIDPGTRPAQVLVEADYHMKLVGLGLEDGVLGLTNYLDLVARDASAAPPSLDVLRWWFTMDYAQAEVSADGHTLLLRGPAVRLQSENEWLAEAGRRTATGQANPWNAQFAADFTAKYSELARKYPIYAELQNVFDLALVAEFLRSGELAARVGWSPTLLADPHAPWIERRAPPAQVESIVSYRVAGRGRLLAAVSGGVSAEPGHWLEPARLRVDRSGKLDSGRLRESPGDAEHSRVDHRGWWWD